MALDITTREAALIIWLGLLLCLILRIRALREGLGAIFKVTFRGPILRWLILMCLYVCLICFVLNRFDLWQFKDLKATLLWLLSAGFYMLYRTADEKPTPKQLIFGIFREGFNLAVILEFLISTFTFSFWVEFCLVPIAGFFMFIASPNKSDDPRAQIAVRFADNALTLIGLAALLYAGIKTVLHWEEFWQAPTAHAFLLPIVLSILFIPLLWALLTYIAYENAFLRIRVLSGELTHPTLLKLRLIWAFGIRYHEVNRWWAYCIVNRPEGDTNLLKSMAISRDFKQ